MKWNNIILDIRNRMTRMLCTEFCIKGLCFIENFVYRKISIIDAVFSDSIFIKEKEYLSVLEASIPMGAFEIQLISTVQVVNSNV